MMTETPQQPPLLEDEAFPLDLMSMGGQDMVLTPEQQAELEADPEAKAILDSLKDGEEDNPLSDKGINELVGIYLKNSTRGVRWLSEKTNISRKILQDFIEGKSSDIDDDGLERIIAVVSKDHHESEKLAALKEERNGSSSESVTRTPYRAPQPPAGLNRQARRKWLAEHKARDRKESTVSDYPRGQTPSVLMVDELAARTVSTTGELPEGLTSSNNGTLSGTPTKPGEYGVDFEVTSHTGSTSHTTTHTVPVTVVSSIPPTHTSDPAKS